jgi:hypothetical protein
VWVGMDCVGMMRGRAWSGWSEATVRDVASGSRRSGRCRGRRGKQRGGRRGGRRRTLIKEEAAAQRRLHHLLDLWARPSHMGALELERVPFDKDVVLQQAI